MLSLMIKVNAPSAVGSSALLACSVFKLNHPLQESCLQVLGDSLKATHFLIVDRRKLQQLANYIPITRSRDPQIRNIAEVACDSDNLVSVRTDQLTVRT